jgi:hypothetical protein
LGDRISNSRLYEKCGSIPLFRAILREMLRWFGHILQKKDGRLPKIVLFGQPFRAKRKTARPRIGQEKVTRKDFRVIKNHWEGVKWEALHRLE